MQDLIALLVDHGAFVVFAATLAARVGAPVPASPLLVVAGGLAVAGQLSWVLALLGSVVANIIGDGVWFQAGRRYGHRVMKLLCRISLSPDSCVRQSESIITRWGGSSLIAAKFLPGVSVVAAPMAGALEMSWTRFVAFELAAALLWSAVFMGLGVVFSNQIQQILDTMANAGVLAGLALALVIAALVARRWWRRRSFMHEMEMARVTVDDLYALMDTPQAPLVVDVRSRASVQIDGRLIPGAVVISLDEIGSRAGELPRDRDIVVYCNCPNEVSAVRAVQLLFEQGHTRARPLAGGLDAWAAAGRPLHTPAGEPHSTPVPVPLTSTGVR